jgi:hypothetical protein
MARKTAVSAAENFRQLKKCSIGNTKVTIDANGNASMFLFGNRIAFRTTDGRTFITTCGWSTSTTYSRLREIGGFGIRGGRNQAINGVPWDGRWVEIVDMPPTVAIFKNEPPIID